MSSAKCPHCDVMVEIRPIVVEGSAVDVGRSSPSYTSTVVARYEIEVLRRYERPGYTVVDCGNCEQRFVVQHHRYAHSERGYPGATVVWPLDKVVVPPDVPEAVSEAVADAKKAHAVQAELASLLAARTAVIRLQREQNVTSIKGLVDSGKLTEILYRQADEIRLWANAQGHEDVQPGTIDSQDVEELLEYLDVVLRSIYVDPARLKKRQEERKNLRDKNKS